MAGTPAGSAKAMSKIIDHYGLTEDGRSRHHVRAGRVGGSAPARSPKGFAAMTPEKRREAGRRGGLKRLGNKYPRRTLTSEITHP